jgi:hypothetical protein
MIDLTVVDPALLVVRLPDSSLNIDILIVLGKRLARVCKYQTRLP